MSSSETSQFKKKKEKEEEEEVIEIGTNAIALVCAVITTIATVDFFLRLKKKNEY